MKTAIDHYKNGCDRPSKVVTVRPNELSLEFRKVLNNVYERLRAERTAFCSAVSAPEGIEVFQLAMAANAINHGLDKDLNSLYAGLEIATKGSDFFPGAGTYVEWCLEVVRQRRYIQDIDKNSIERRKVIQQVESVPREVRLASAEICFTAARESIRNNGNKRRSET